MAHDGAGGHQGQDTAYGAGRSLGERTLICGWPYLGTGGGQSDAAASRG